MLNNFLKIGISLLILVVLATQGQNILEISQKFLHTSDETATPQESTDTAIKSVPPIAPLPNDTNNIQKNVPKPLHQVEIGNTENTTVQPAPDAYSSENKTEAVPVPIEAPQVAEDTSEEPILVDKDMPIPGEKALTERTIIKQIAKGDILSKILAPYCDANDSQRFVNSLKGVFSVRSFRVGHPYTITYKLEDKSIVSFEYEIDFRKKLVVQGTPYTAKIVEIPYEKRLTLVKSTINGNLFNTIEDTGEQPQLALLIADLFRWDINFIRDIKEGDSFSVLVEKLYRDGIFKGYGKTLGSSFTNKGKTYEAFLFYDANKKENYYNLKGESLRKVLLQSPLSFTRVTSGYTHRRKHPIFGNYRPHLGIDYGAPSGTPIMAVGDGVITVRSWRGGYGRQVVLRHSGGLESLYSHMSRYAKGQKVGSRVRQGQVIGYVGSTGYSTGPHLDFRLRQNGKFINPSKAINPRSEGVHKKDKKKFEAHIENVRKFMDGKKDLKEYNPDKALSSR